MRLSLYLSEMAYNLKTSVKNIDGIMDTFVEHLLKCLIINNIESVYYWKDEICGYLKEIRRSSNLKIKSKILPLGICRKKFRYHYSEYEIKNIVHDIEKEYGLKRIDDRKIDEYRDYVEKYFEDMWVDVSSGDFDIYKYLDRVDYGCGFNTE